MRDLNGYWTGCSTVRFFETSAFARVHSDYRRICAQQWLSLLTLAAIGVLYVLGVLVGCS